MADSSSSAGGRYDADLLELMLAPQPTNNTTSSASCSAASHNSTKQQQQQQQQQQQTRARKRTSSYHSVHSQASVDELLNNNNNNTYAYTSTNNHGNNYTRRPKSYSHHRTNSFGTTRGSRSSRSVTGNHNTAGSAAAARAAPNKPKHTRNSTWGGADVPFYPTTITHHTNNAHTNHNHNHHNHSNYSTKRSSVPYNSNSSNKPTNNSKSNNKQQQESLLPSSLLLVNNNTHVARASGTVSGVGGSKIASSTAPAPAPVTSTNSNTSLNYHHHHHNLREDSNNKHYNNVGNNNHNNGNNQQQQIGFAMKRFLTDDVVDAAAPAVNTMQAQNKTEQPLSPGGMIVNSNMGVTSRSIEFEAMSSCGYETTTSDDDDVSELLASEMVVLHDEELDEQDDLLAGDTVSKVVGDPVGGGATAAAGMDAYSIETWNMENVGAVRRARVGSSDGRQKQPHHHHSHNVVQPYASAGNGGGDGAFNMNIDVMNHRSMLQQHDDQHQQDQNYQFVPPNNMMIEGFDYDKNRPSVDSSYQHGSEFMTYSVKTHSYEDVEYADRFSSNYGSTEPREKGIDDNTEALPFISTGGEGESYEGDRPNQSMRNRRSSMDDVFSSVRSVSTADIEADMNESEHYLMSSFFQRAFPERLVALLITLVIEIPVLFMITGGSDRLCKVIGRHRYQLLMAFLPLASAISGNCGLQGSSLTTRAISHSHVTKKTYMKWLRSEVEASCCLGVVMGFVIGISAYFASNFDAAFGVTIGIGQFVSILTAGFTGTVAPLLFSFIFHRDSGKWSGPLETAIQDIMGSFAMIILSYYLILWLGPREVESWDTCGVGA